MEPKTTGQGPVVGAVTTVWSGQGGGKTLDIEYDLTFAELYYRNHDYSYLNWGNGGIVVLDSNKQEAIMEVEEEVLGKPVSMMG